MKLSMDEILKGKKFYLQTEEIQANLNQLLPRVNILLADFLEWLKETHPDKLPQVAVCTSGLRSIVENKEIYDRINAYNREHGLPEVTVKEDSSHIPGMAADILDSIQLFQEYLKTERAKKLYESLDLYFEHFSATPNWVHVTTRRPPSGNRFFHP